MSSTWGITSTTSHLASLMLACPWCDSPAAHRVHRAVRRLTLGVPLLTVKRANYVVCTSCGAETDVSPQDASRLVAAQSMQPPCLPLPAGAS